MAVHSQSGPQAIEANLARMANQIAANYAHHEFSVAAGEIANHFKRFWTPAMRADLAAMAASGGWELQPLVLEAVSLLSVR